MWRTVGGINVNACVGISVVIIGDMMKWVYIVIGIFLFLVAWRTCEHFEQPQSSDVIHGSVEQ